MNTKDRAERMQLNSLSSHDRQVYAALELGTMGFSSELAVEKTATGTRPMTPSDIVRRTKLSDQNVRRALENLERVGLAGRRAADGGKLRRGKVLIYSWATPRAPISAWNKRETSQRALETLPLPDPLRAFAKRRKYEISPDISLTRDQLEEGERVARVLKEAEELAARFWETVGARPRAKRSNNEVERNVRNIVSKSEPDATPAEDDSLTQTEKTAAATEVVSAAVETEFAPFPSTSDPLRAEFEKLPAEFGVPAAAVADCIRDKIREKQRKRYPIENHGALLRFVREALPGWIRQHGDVIRRYCAADGPTERRASESRFAAPEDFDADKALAETNGRAKGAGA